MAAFLKSLRRLRSCLYWTFDSPDSDLEWRQQAEAVERNPMYKLVHLGGKGVLVEEYLRRESDDQYRELLQRRVSSFLYIKGDGGLIREMDYVRYRNAGNQEYLSDEELLEDFRIHQLTAINRFTPHPACWDLTKRGEAGETIIHLCYLNCTTIHKAIASHLLQLYPRLALDIYEGSAYYGETALHIAIVNNDLEAVKLLVNQGKARLDARATGHFFRPGGLRDLKAIKFEELDYEAKAYYGEYPLAFAASLGLAEIYDYLIEASMKFRDRGTCDPNEPDSFGNTVMHMIVIHNQMLMFSHVVFHSKKPASFTQKNGAGLTPMQLSYKLGRGELFSALLDLTSETQWVFGNVAYVAYPLDQLDSIGQDGSINYHAAITTIVENDDMEHLKMLDGQVINELLDKKWKTYAKSHLFFKFYWALLHLLLLSLVVYLRPEKDLWETESIANKFRFFAESCLILGCFAKITAETLEVISRGSILNYLVSLWQFPTKGLFMISIWLQLSCIVWRVLRYQVLEDYAFIISIPMSWHYLFFFFRGHPVLGPLVVSLQKIIAGDLVRFSFIYVIFLTMFSEAFYYMFLGVPASETNAFLTANGAIMTVFRMSFGDMHFPDMSHSRYNAMTYIIFGLFMTVIPLLLFNMMIAMMTRTFENIKERSLMEWKRQWVMLILNVERAIPRRFLLKFQREYSSTLRFHKDQKARRIHQRPVVVKTKGLEPERTASASSLVADGTDGWSIPLVKIPPTRRVDHPQGDDTEWMSRQALLVHKVLPKSQAAMRRDVQAKWRSLKRKILDEAKARLTRQKTIANMKQGQLRVEEAVRTAPDWEEHEFESSWS